MKYTNAKGQVVGEYFEDALSFFKEVDPEKHFMHTLKSWGFDADIVADLKKRGCIIVSLRIRKTRELLHTKLKTLLKHGVYKDYGHGVQVFLEDKYFAREVM